MTLMLACSTCPRTLAVATGATAHAMTQEKLANLALKIGWDVVWKGGKIAATTCPTCISDLPQSDDRERKPIERPIDGGTSASRARRVG